MTDYMPTVLTPEGTIVDPLFHLVLTLIILCAIYKLAAWDLRRHKSPVQRIGEYFSCAWKSLFFLLVWTVFGALIVFDLLKKIARYMIRPNVRAKAGRLVVAGVKAGCRLLSRGLCALGSGIIVGVCKLAKAG